MSDQGEREAQQRAVAKKAVVYQVPGMESVTVRRDLLFHGESGRDLLMDVYYPPSSREGLPVVVMPIAYPDPTGRIRAFGPVTSWARLLAASGLATVVYGAESPEKDAHAALEHVRASGATLRVDVDRIGLFATSANVTVGLSALMHDRRLTCAAFMYGYTMDLDGSTAVASAAAQFGFVDACAGRSIDELPSVVPILFVRAGRDAFPGLNTALDVCVGQALARNVPVWLINHATAAHGFDLDDDSDVSHGIVQQALVFLQLHLRA